MAETSLIKDEQRRMEEYIGWDAYKKRSVFVSMNLAGPKIARKPVGHTTGWWAVRQAGLALCRITGTRGTRPRCVRRPEPSDPGFGTLKTLLTRTAFIHGTCTRLAWRIHTW